MIGAQTAPTGLCQIAASHMLLSSNRRPESETRIAVRAGMGYMRIMQVTCTRHVPAQLLHGLPGADHDEQHPDLNNLA